eukprot:1852002-Lingulodinium_polyedra.AAC.1
MAVDLGSTRDELDRVAVLRAMGARGFAIFFHDGVGLVPRGALVIGCAFEQAGQATSRPDGG